MGPGDKLKNFMQKFIKPKNQGQVTGVKNRKLAKGLTGDPYKDEEIIHGKSTESIFNRPLTVEEQRSGAPKFIGKIKKKKQEKQKQREETEQRHKKIYADQEKAKQDNNFSSSSEEKEEPKKTRKKQQTRHIPTKF